jgi:nitrate reductase delta subunit
MVDLMKNYQQAGLEISVNELPDFIPLYLEFLSTQGDDNAKAWLQDVAHIFGVLSTRLHKRECDYAVLFEALIELSGVELDLTEVIEQVAKEKRDDTKEAIDKVWEEEAVTFGGDATNGGCPTSTNRPEEGQSRDQEVPINWMDATQPTHKTQASRV